MGDIDWSRVQEGISKPHAVGEMCISVTEEIIE